MIVSSLLLVVSLAGVGGAQKCDTATTTAALLQCLDADVRTLNARLQQKETAMAKRMSPVDADLFHKASVAWHSFEDLECQSEGAQFRGGTLAPVAELQCRSRLVKQRIADLEVAFKKTR